MTDYTTLQDRVKRRVIDLPASITTEVPDLVNQVLRRAQEKHDFWVMRAETVDQVTVVGSHTVEVASVTADRPSDWKGLRAKPYFREFSGGETPIQYSQDPKNVRALYGFNDPNQTGEPRVLVEAEPSDESGTVPWEIWPYPDGLSDWSDGEYRLRVPYWKFLSPLSAGGDSNWFTNQSAGENYIVDQVTAEAFYLAWDQEQGVLWENRAQVKFAELLQLDKRARISEMVASNDTLIPYADVNAPKLPQR